MTTSKTPRLICLFFAFLLFACPLMADEGMWTLDNLPLSELKKKYGFEPTQAWVKNVQLASVRFNDGGSGAFVSPKGLVITNHHVALGQLQKLSSAKNDYVKNGFYARSSKQEIACPDLELNVLVEIKDVSASVLKAINIEGSAKQKSDKRRAVIAQIEKESFTKTGLRSNVIELYQGGKYHLYVYQKYKDVRLVMAPEVQAAFFGGDYDNFTYPRYALDFAFFRVYQNNKPVDSKHYFRWSKNGASENELVFVAGNPGSTRRLKTTSQLKFERDYSLPLYLKNYKSKLSALQDYAKRGPEQKRRASRMIFGLENGLKALTGMLQGLKASQFMENHEKSEKILQAHFKSQPRKTRKLDNPWKELGKVQKQRGKVLKKRAYRRVDSARLAKMALGIVLYSQEVQKPNEKRYEEFRDSALDSWHFRILSPAPVYADLEEEMLAFDLAQMLSALGKNDDFVKVALGEQKPKDLAQKLIKNTKLFGPAYREQLLKGGAKAINASKDPLIMWAVKLEPHYRELRDWYKNHVEIIEAEQGAKIANARFGLYGTSTYPDATFTLRLSYGKVAGYKLNTTLVPSKTTFYGLFGRAADFNSRFPFNVSRLEKTRQSKINMATPVNFVTTNDIVGGNSGSPVFNSKGEYVGLIFDGNIQSLVSTYAYSDNVSRAVAVHSSGIVEALKNIYQMPALLSELGQG